jgi:hypothetical protein
MPRQVLSTLQDCEDFIRGCQFMATGGGGSEEEGKEIFTVALKERHMRVMVLGGSGKMGRAVTWDLIKQDDIEVVELVEWRQETRAEVRKLIGSAKIAIHSLNVEGRDSICRFFPIWVLQFHYYLKLLTNVVKPQYDLTMKLRKKTQYH